MFFVPIWRRALLATKVFRLFIVYIVILNTSPTLLSFFAFILFYFYSILIIKWLCYRNKKIFLFFILAPLFFICVVCYIQKIKKIFLPFLYFFFNFIYRVKFLLKMRCYRVFGALPLPSLALFKGILAGEGFTLSLFIPLTAS